MVSIEGDEIVVRVPVSCMQLALQNSEYGYRAEAEYGHPLTVTDERGFAHEVVYELLAEEEDGSTLLTDALDRAQQRAVENGSEFIAENLQ